VGGSPACVWKRQFREGDAGVPQRLLLDTHEPTRTFGSEQTSIDGLEIGWPSGQVDRLRSVPLDRILIIEEGKGITHVLEARKKLAK